MVGLVQALINLLAALAGSFERLPNQSQLDFCVPVISDLTTLYDSDRVQLEQKVSDYLATVRARWERAQDQGLIPFLQNSRAAQDQMADQDVKWLGGLRGEKIGKFYHRVWFGQFPVELAIELVQKAPTTALLAMTMDKTALETSIIQLRRLDDLLIRVLSAKTAAGLSGCTLAEILALYRTEGNLSVPRSHDSLQQLIPPREPAHFEATMMNDASLPFSPNLAAQVFLHDRSFFTSEEKAKNYALLVWMVQLAGLDIVARDGFSDWSANNWSSHTQTSISPADRQAVYDLLKSKMIVETVRREAATGQLVATPGFGPDGFLRISPQDPEFLVSTVLADAALFLRRSGRPQSFGAPAGYTEDWIAPPRLSYTMYNLQVGTPEKQGCSMPKEAFLMSAVDAAWRSKSYGPQIRNRYQPIRAEIESDTQLKDALGTQGVLRKAIPGCITGEEIAAGYPIIRQWLLDDAKGEERIRLVSHFVETENRVVWTSWDEAGLNSYRGNANRFHLLYVYFHLLTQEDSPF